MGRRSSELYSDFQVDMENYRRSSRILVRVFGCMLAVLLLLPLAMAEQTGYLAGYQTTTRDTSHGDQQTTGGGEPSRTVGVIGIPVYSGCDFPAMGSTGGASEARAETLDKHGPQLPPLYSMSSFTVMGFSKGNWPIVVDYLLEDDSLLLVVVAPEGQKPLIYHLAGKKGHWQTRIQLPPSVGDQLRVSQYVVQTLDNGVGQVSPSHVHIHGIAAGPKAVGSIGIDKVNFAPGSIQLAQHQKARYSFHSIFDFKNTEVSFIRLAKSSSGEIFAASVGNKSTGKISQGGQLSGDWDGTIKTGDIVKTYPAELQQWLLAPRGQHVLQVRAWLGAKDGGDWVTALSDTIVTVE